MNAPQWLVALIITLVGGWALARFVDSGLAAIFVLLGIVATVLLVYPRTRP